MYGQSFGGMVAQELSLLHPGRVLALVLQRFWQTGFKRDWSALEPILRSESFHLKDLHENSTLPELIESLGRRGTKAAIITVKHSAQNQVARRK